MKKKIYIIIGVILLFALVLTGCFKKDSDEEANLLATGAQKNGIEAVAVYGDNVVTDWTKDGKEVIPKNIAKIDGNRLLFQNYIELRIGDIVLVTVYNQDNVVAKEITKKISNFEYEGIDANLDDVFDDLFVDTSARIKEDYVDKTSLPQGVSIVGSKEYAMATGIVDYSKVEEGLKYVITDYELYNDGLSKVTIDASVLLKTPQVNFDFSWRNKTVDLKLETGDSAMIAIKGNAQKKIEGDINLGTYTIPISVYGISIGSIDISLYMKVSAQGEVEFYAKATQDLDIAFGIGGELFTNLDAYSNIKVPQDAKDYFSLEVNSKGSVDLAAGMSPGFNLSLLQYSIFNTSGNIGVEAVSTIATDMQEFNYKALVNPYVKLEWKIMGLDKKERDFLDGYKWDYEIRY